MDHDISAASRADNGGCEGGGLYALVIIPLTTRPPEDRIRGAGGDDPGKNGYDARREGGIFFVCMLAT